MTTQVTSFSRTLASYSYSIGSIIQKIFSGPITFYYTNHCGKYIGGRGHCGSSSPSIPLPNHCGRPIGGYRNHC